MLARRVMFAVQALVRDAVVALAVAVPVDVALQAVTTVVSCHQLQHQLLLRLQHLSLVRH